MCVLHTALIYLLCYHSPQLLNIINHTPLRHNLQLGTWSACNGNNNVYSALTITITINDVSKMPYNNHQSRVVHFGNVNVRVTLIFAYSGGWSPNWVHSAPRPFTVILCLPRVIVRMENYSVE
jgi:hypothetical protein